jgi:predicted RNA binding protein YcfA (HicA-like mRNA interferase family)
MRAAGFAFQCGHQQGFSEALKIARLERGRSEVDAKCYYPRSESTRPHPRDQKDGWYLVRTRGSHRQYKHPTKSGLVTIAGKPSDDLGFKTFKSILKQAGLQP